MIKRKCLWCENFHQNPPPHSGVRPQLSVVYTDSNHDIANIRMCQHGPGQQEHGNTMYHETDSC